MSNIELRGNISAIDKNIGKAVIPISSLQAFRRQVALIFKERISACSHWFLSIWKFWLARAEAWESWREYEDIESSLPPNSSVSGHMAFHYADYLRMLESQRIIRKAYKLGVPVTEEQLESLDIFLLNGKREVLTEEGRLGLLPKINEAAMNRRKEIGYWTGVMIGVIGAVTGLVSVLSS